MRTFIVNYNFPEEYKGTYQVTVEDSLTAGMEAAKKVHKYLAEKFGEVKDSSSTIIEVYGTIHKIDNYTKDELVKMFYQKFGTKEVKLKRSLLLEDDRSGFMSSGARAWLTHLRAKSETEIEYFYAFWDSGWRNDNEYSAKVITALKQVLGIK